MLRSTCPNHLILLVRRTTSRSRMPSFVERESELRSSFALILEIQRIMTRSLRRRRFSVSTSWPKSLLHAEPHSSHMMSTPDLRSKRALMAVGKKGKHLAEHASCAHVACDRSQLKDTSCRQHVSKITKIWDKFKLPWTS